MHAPRFLTALPIAAALAVGSLAHAQEGGQPARPQNSDPVASAQPRPSMPVIDVDFKGGTVAQFVQAVQQAAMQASKTPVNIMVPAEAQQVELPPIQFRRVSAETALQSLQYAFGDRNQHTFAARNMTSSGDESLTFAIQYVVGRTPGVPQSAFPMQPTMSQAYSLRDLITAPPNASQSDASLRMSADTVLGALKLAAELESGDKRVEPTQLLFHPDTQLVIARGTQDQLRLIENVIGQLSATLAQRRDVVANDDARRQHTELQQIELQAQIDAAKAQLDRALSEQRPAQVEVARLEKLVASGSASTSDLERARAQREVAQANARAAEAHLAMLERRREILSRGAGHTTVPDTERIVGLYDLRDLNSFKGDFYQLVKQVIGKEGTMSVKPAGGDSTGTIEVRTTRAQHEALVSIFNTARRLKSNEPKLPGITVDQVLQKDKE